MIVDFRYLCMSRYPKDNYGIHLLYWQRNSRTNLVGEDATIHRSNAVTVLLWMGSGIDLAVLIVYSQFIRQIVLVQGRFLMTVRHKDRAPSCPSFNEKGTKKARCL